MRRKVGGRFELYDVTAHRANAAAPSGLPQQRRNRHETRPTALLPVTIGSPTHGRQRFLFPARRHGGGIN